MKGKRVNNKKKRAVWPGSRKKSSGQMSGASHRSSTQSLPLKFFPKEFQLSGNFSGVVGAIAQLRRMLENRGARLRRICVSTIATIDNAAALMLGAEVKVWGDNNPNMRPPFHNKLWNLEVQGLLTQMGLFPLLDFPRSVRSPTRATDWAFMPVISNSNVDMEKFTAFRKDIEREIRGPMTARHYMFIGLSEAVSNVVQHAYEDGKVKHWWASAAHCQSTGELKIICYDRGQTIPKTLPSSNIREQLGVMMSKLGLNHAIDCDLIEGALRTRRTMTKQTNRGRGFPQLMDFVDQVDHGSLKIYSRNGMVTYTKSTKSGSGEGRYTKGTLSKEINGTLIEWSIFLLPEKNAKKSPYSGNDKSRQAPLPFRDRGEI